jgi:putative transposase
LLGRFADRWILESHPTVPGMPDRKHLRRLSNVWVKKPVYFLTACTNQRRPILTNPRVPDLLIESWRASEKINGWVIGRYVVMPDHVHFFAQQMTDAKTLNAFIRDWKRWTAGEIRRVSRLEAPIGQSEFFDHVLRSAKSYEEKWIYVRENPVRAGLVTQAEAWPHAGECETLHF